MNEEFYTLVNYVEQVSDKLGLGDKEWILKSITTKFTNLLRS